MASTTVYAFHQICSLGGCGDVHALVAKIEKAKHRALDCEKITEENLTIGFAHPNTGPTAWTTLRINKNSTYENRKG